MAIKALGNPKATYKAVWNVSGTGAASGPYVYPGAGTWIGDRGIAAGGNKGGGHSDTIDYYDISSISNAGDFGDLTTPRHAAWGCSNTTRGLICGGYNTIGSIDYITTVSYTHLTLPTKA